MRLLSLRCVSIVQLCFMILRDQSRVSLNGSLVSPSLTWYSILTFFVLMEPFMDRHCFRVAPISWKPVPKCLPPSQVPNRQSGTYTSRLGDEGRTTTNRQAGLPLLVCSCSVLWLIQNSTGKLTVGPSLLLPPIVPLSCSFLSERSTTPSS